MMTEKKGAASGIALRNPGGGVALLHMPHALKLKIGKPMSRQGPAHCVTQHLSQTVQPQTVGKNGKKVSPPLQVIRQGQDAAQAHNGNKRSRQGKEQPAGKRPMFVMGAKGGKYEPSLKLRDGPR